MSRRSHTLQRVFAATLCIAPLAVGAAQTRMLPSPTGSTRQIAFAYANNIWTVDRAGGAARRLTSFQGTTENPKFSPDGKLIAFSAQYAGNVDVYVIPAEGGDPKRLTWHPGADIVQGWTPDGKYVLFTSAREGNPGLPQKFYKVNVAGGTEEALIIPFGAVGSLSGDGEKMAY